MAQRELGESGWPESTVSFLHGRGFVLSHGIIWRLKLKKSRRDNILVLSPNDLEVPPELDFESLSAEEKWAFKEKVDGLVRKALWSW